MELLRVAEEQVRIFVTRDRDFGGLVFVRGSGAGVIYLRMLPSILNAVHAELERVLTLYSEQELQLGLLSSSRRGIVSADWYAVPFFFSECHEKPSTAAAPA